MRSHRAQRNLLRRATPGSRVNQLHRWQMGLKYPLATIMPEIEQSGRRIHLDQMNEVEDHVM
jgi:hypothetical protein